MADLLTISQTITVGDITTYLMANDYAKGALFGQRLTIETSATLVAYTTDALRWQYEGQPTDSTLRGTANYDLWLCGKFRLEAQSITGGGGTVIPIPPSKIVPNPIEFYVSVSSVIPIDGSTLLLDGTNGNPDWRGYNMLFSRNNQLQVQITDNLSSYFLWNKTSGLFQCFPVAAEFELFSLNPTV